MIDLGPSFYFGSKLLEYSNIGSVRPGYPNAEPGANRNYPFGPVTCDSGGGRTGEIEPIFEFSIKF